MVRQTVEQRTRHLGIGKYRRPVGAGEIRRNHDRRPLIEPADQVKQQLAAGLRERQVSELSRIMISSRFKRSAMRPCRASRASASSRLARAIAV